MTRWVVILIAINLAAAPRPSADQNSNWRAPAAAAAKTNPLAQKTGAAGGGGKLFQRDCAQCHGAGGSGGMSGAPNLRLERVQKQSDGALFWKITNGNLDRGMPSFSSLPQLQRWQLVLYLREVGKASKPASRAAPAKR